MAVSLGAIEQAVRGERVRARGDALEGVLQPVAGGGLAHPVQHRLGLHRAAELALQEGAVGLALGRGVRVEEEGQPVDARLDVRAGRAQLGERAVEADGAEEAPRADEVGNEVDVQDHGEGVSFDVRLGKRGCGHVVRGGAQVKGFLNTARPR